MRLGDKKIFLDRNKLNFLLNLRMADVPFSVDSLAMVFSCDKRAIRNQCDRYSVSPEGKPFSIKRIMEAVFNDEAGSQWQMLDGKRVNKGHSYEHYLNKVKYSPLYSKGDFYS